MSDITLKLAVRKTLQGIDFESPGQLSELLTNSQLELLVASASSPHEEYVRSGRAFVINTTAAIAAVVAIPTTAHMLALFNNEPDGGRCYIIDWVAAQNVVSTAVASQAQILVNVGQIREATPVDAGLSIKKLNGTGSAALRGDTKAIAILNATALPAGTGLAANWFPWGRNTVKTGAAATPGYGMWEPVDGRIIIPPGRYFAMHVLANVVGETFVAFMSWHEKVIETL